MNNTDKQFDEYFQEFENAWREGGDPKVLAGNIWSAAFWCEPTDPLQMLKWHSIAMCKNAEATNRFNKKLTVFMIVQMAIAAMAIVIPLLLK